MHVGRAATADAGYVPLGAKPDGTLLSTVLHTPGGETSDGTLLSTVLHAPGGEISEGTLLSTGCMPLGARSRTGL